MDHNLEMTLFDKGLTAAWTAIAVRTFGRSRLRWEGDCRVGLGKIQNWTKEATEREVWK